MGRGHRSTGAVWASAWLGGPRPAVWAGRGCGLRRRVGAGLTPAGGLGSTAVRRIIEDYEPVLSVHGHIHESGGERRIGKTLCVNPGSEANHGILRGYLIDIGRKGVELAQRVEG